MQVQALQLLTLAIVLQATLPLMLPAGRKMESIMIFMEVKTPVKL